MPHGLKPEWSLSKKTMGLGNHDIQWTWNCVIVQWEYVFQERGTPICTRWFLDSLSTSCSKSLFAVDVSKALHNCVIWILACCEVAFNWKLSIQLDSILLIEARDGDFGLNWDVKYALEDGFGVFEIDQDSGNLTVLSSADVDRESEELASGYYTLSVTVFYQFLSSWNCCEHI